MEFIMDARQPLLTVNPPGRGRVFYSIVDAIGDNADRSPAQIAAGARRQRDHPAKLEYFNPAASVKAHRGCDGDRDGKGRHHQCDTVLHRADLGKYRDRARLVAASRATV